MPVILMSGPKFSGKSRFIERLVARLNDKKIPVGGFFQRGMFRKPDEKIGYELVSASDGTAVPIARSGGEGVRWQFYMDAFEKAAGMFDGGADVFVIDEIGPLEVAGQGHRRTLQHALGKRVPLLVVVRSELADEARKIIGTSREIIEIQYSPENDKNISKQIIGMLIENHVSTNGGKND